MSETPSCSRTAGQRPLRRDAERNRLKILEAAGEVFSREGLDATMDRIAEAAGVGIATMYRRFPDKSDLIDALFEERIEKVVQVGEESLTFTDGWEGLVYFMAESLTMFAANRGLADVVFEPSAQGPKTLSRSRQRLPGLGEQLIQRAQEQGRLRPDMETTDLPMLQLMISLIVRFAGDVSPDLWQRYLTIILDGLRSDRRRPAPLPVAALDTDEMEVALTRGELSSVGASAELSEQRRGTQRSGAGVPPPVLSLGGTAGRPEERTRR